MQNKPLFNKGQEAKLKKSLGTLQKATWQFKAFISFFLAFFFVLFFILGFPAITQLLERYFPSNNWSIPKFNVKIELLEDGRTLVKENIQADFSKEKHHGIFRYVPLYYNDAQNQKMDLGLNAENVTDNLGEMVYYTRYYDQDSMILQIGSPDQLVNNLTDYFIEYTSNHAIRHYPDYDELYWNATGNDWPVNIQQSTVEVTFPKNLDAQKIKLTCFSGSTGSKEQNCTSSIDKTEDGTQLFSFKATKELKTKEGLTIAVAFPKGVISEIAPIPYIRENYYNSNNPDSGPIDWVTVFFTIFTFPIGLSIIYFIIWLMVGRDPKAERSTIVPTFDPPENLKPAQIGALTRDYIKDQDLSATIVDLCVRGYIKIKELKDKDYEFIKLKDFNSTNGQSSINSTLKDYEKELLMSIFKEGQTRKLSSLNTHFAKSYKKIQTQIYDGLVNKGYYSVSPEKVITKYEKVGSVFFGLAFFLGIGFEIALGASFLLAAILTFIFGRLMPRKTALGSNVSVQILGMVEYIKTAEKDRLKFQEKENIFEKMLPYAMVLGVADKWTKAFADIYTTPPDWYEGRDPNFMNSFNSGIFISSLSHMSSQMGSAFSAAAPSRSSGGGSGFSSGGGFSGGGSGGGGGGAW